jgi:tetratricopeptide (TPR) repeat protein
MEMAQYAPAVAASMKRAGAQSESASPALGLHSRKSCWKPGARRRLPRWPNRRPTANAADADAWATRAAVAYATGKLQPALEHYERAIDARSPDHTEALLGRSSVLMDTRSHGLKPAHPCSHCRRQRKGAARVLSACSHRRSGGRSKRCPRSCWARWSVSLIRCRAVLTSRSHLALIAGLSHLGLGGKVKAKGIPATSCRGSFHRNSPPASRLRHCRSKRRCGIGHPDA